MSRSPIPVIVVAGPTASGKTAFAINLSRRIQSEIVNIDSVQLYREADIGSAKATREERGETPHHCIDIRDPSERMDAKEFSQVAGCAIEGIVARGHVPILVAGTTLYFKALLHGIADLPPADPSFRRGVEHEPTELLYATLQLKDPKTALRLHKNDRIRIIRALEILEHSATSVEERRGDHGFQLSKYTALIFVLWWDRKVLHDRIAQRVRAMISGGLREETNRIVERYGEAARPLSTIGYRECVQVLRGEMQEDQLEERIVIATRRLAKQQSTFWKNEPLKRGWIVSPLRGGNSIESSVTNRNESLHTPLDLSGSCNDDVLARAREFLSSPSRENQVVYVGAK